MKSLLTVLCLLLTSTAYALPPVSVGGAEGGWITAYAYAARLLNNSNYDAGATVDEEDIPATGSNTFPLDSTGLEVADALKSWVSTTWRAEAETQVNATWTPIDIAGAPTTVDNPFIELDGTVTTDQKIPGDAGKESNVRGEAAGSLIRWFQHTGPNGSQIEITITFDCVPMSWSNKMPTKSYQMKSWMGGSYVTATYDQINQEWDIVGYGKQTSGGSFAAFSTTVAGNSLSTQTYTFFVPADNNEWIESGVRLGSVNDPRSTSLNDSYTLLLLSPGGSAPVLLSESSSYPRIKQTAKVTATTY